MWMSKRVRNGPPEAVADCIMRRRVQSLYFILPIYLFVLVGFFVKISLVGQLEGSGWNGWLIVTAMLLAILSRDPARGRVSAEVRAFLDDDLTRANRQCAQQTGFWIAVIVGILLLVVRLAVTINLSQAILAIVGGAVFGATLHYLLLERSALRG